MTARRKPKKPRIGRPPSADPTRPITARLPESQIKSLRAIADKQGITLRQAIAESVETAIERGSTR